jgi:hypothetical protein
VVAPVADVQLPLISNAQPYASPIKHSMAGPPSPV